MNADPLQAAHLLVETQAALRGSGISWPCAYRLTTTRRDGAMIEAGCDSAEAVAQMIEDMNYPEIMMFADADPDHALREVDAVLAALRRMFTTLH